MKAKTPTIKAAALAVKFFEELVASVETLGAVADEHGVPTLSDLSYLQGAILTGGFIDAWPESHVNAVVKALPSAAVWSRYIRQVNDSGEVSEVAGTDSLPTPGSPRVLVTVSGGVADYIADDGVEVVVFDHDDHKVGGRTGHVPSRFRDLAQRAFVPVSE